ncbi:hypothetical protein PMAYCL1PPCAC_00520, partial [Pristionchus mayeri]
QHRHALLQLFHIRQMSTSDRNDSLSFFLGLGQFPLEFDEWRWLGLLPLWNFRSLLLFFCGIVIVDYDHLSLGRAISACAHFVLRA